MTWFSRFRFFQTSSLVVALSLAALLAPGAVEPAAAFCTTGTYPWSQPTILKTLVMPTNFPTGMRAGVQGALAQWSARPNSTLMHAYAYSATYYQQQWQGQYFWPDYMSYSSDPAVAVYYVADGKHSSGQLYFNPLYVWVDAPQDLSQGIADVQTVAVHEIGHFVGLQHPFPGPTHCSDKSAYTAEEQLSVMTGISTGKRRWINSDDLAGLTFLY